MKDQHTLIKGYRDLNEEEISAMNEIKEHAEKVRILLSALEDTQDFVIDKRWHSIARTYLQKGFMALVRCVAQPKLQKKV